MVIKPGGAYLKYKGRQSESFWIGLLFTKLLSEFQFLNLISTIAVPYFQHLYIFWHHKISCLKTEHPVKGWKQSPCKCDLSNWMPNFPTGQGLSDSSRMESFINDSVLQKAADSRMHFAGHVHWIIYIPPSLKNK